MANGATLTSPNHIQALAADASDLPSSGIPLEPSTAPPQQPDFTEVQLKDGTRLRLKGRNLGPEQIQAGVSKFKQHTQSAATPQQTGIPTEPPEQEGPATRYMKGVTEAASGLPGDIRQWPKAIEGLTNGPIPDGLDPTGGGLNAALNLGKGVIESSTQAARTGMNRFKRPGVGNKIAGGLEYAASGIPVVGPNLVKGYEQAESGDVAGGMGTETGVGLQLAAGSPAAREGIASTLNKIPEVASDVAQGTAEKIAGPIVRKPPAATQNDLKFGRNPAEAITREPGLRGLTKDGLRAGVSQRMNELGGAIDDTLSTPQANSKGKLDVEPIIDQAEKDALSSPTAKLNPSLRTRISDMADEMRTRWGDLQKSPLDAARMKRDIGSAAKWTGQPFDNEANQFLVDVYRGINGKVNDAVPEVAPLNGRYADLLSAKSALDRRIAFDTNRPASIGRTVLGAMGGAGGTAAGGLIGGAPGAAAGAVLDLARTTPGRLAVSRGLSRLAGTQYEPPAATEPQIGPFGEPDYSLPDKIGFDDRDVVAPPSGAGRIDMVGQQNPDLAVMQQQNPAPVQGEVVGRNRGLQLPAGPKRLMLPGAGETSVSREPGAESVNVDQEPLPLEFGPSSVSGMVQRQGPTGTQFWPPGTPDEDPVNFTGEESEQGQPPMEPPGFESQSRQDVAAARELSPEERADSLSRELSNDRALLRQNPTGEERTILESRIAENRQILEDMQNEASGQERPIFAVPEQGDLHDIVSEVERKQEAGEPIPQEDIEQLHDLADRADSALREEPDEEAVNSQIAKAQRRVDYLKSKIRTSRSRSWSDIMPQLQEAQEALDKVRANRKPPSPAGEVK